MTDKSVYLCGPITGLSHDEARLSWRKQVFDELAPHDITCYSPMRYKDFLKGEENLAAAGYANNVLSSHKGITTRDRWDVSRSSLIFCNLLGSKIVTVGSMIEFGWADAYRIPVIACMEDDGSNIHEHCMVEDIVAYKVPTVEAGIEVAKALLIPGV